MVKKYEDDSDKSLSSEVLWYSGCGYEQGSLLEGLSEVEFDVTPQSQ